MSNRSKNSSISLNRRPGSVAARRIRDLLDDCIQRRAAGEAVNDTELIAANSDLMPALGEELELLRVMDRAATRARDESTRPGASERASRFRFTLATPERIGGYRIIREIHRGAQGVVYLAEQESTRREVAVKVLVSRAFAKAAEKARFVREAEILAKLRHPNIIAIHDTGIADGCHYFAMDYIEGPALDDDLKSVKRSVREVVEIFVQIADAVSAAHLRGVIHRDLKPSNIRVDSNGRPHVLDFGLAKDIAGQAGQSMTAEGQFVGSLPWASPEQVAGTGDLDIRSDVYSLGVILFQSLTGAFPYKVAGAIQSVIATITSVEPARPIKLRREIGGELETIVLRCLQKSPERRYQSAGELAADLRRFLAGEPIEAKRDSTLYVIGKHLRRHRLSVAFAVTLLAGVIGFAIFAAAQAKHSRQMADREAGARKDAEGSKLLALAAQAEAEKQRDEARRAGDAEAAQRRIAENAAVRAETIKNFFIQTMGVANPDVSQSGAVTLDKLLDRAAAQIDATFADDVASEAAVRTVVGQAYATLGHPELARQQLERAVEIHEKILETPREEYYETLWTYMSALGDLGRQDEWRTRWWQVFRLYPSLLGKKNPALSSVIRTISASHASDRYSEEKSLPHFFQLQRIAETSIPPSDPAWLIMADYLHLVGDNLGLKFRKDGGIRVLKDALVIERRFLAETNPRVVRTSAALTTLLLETGRNREAEIIARDSLAALERSLAPDNWFLAMQRARVAACQNDPEQLDAAEAVLLGSLKIVEAEHDRNGRYATEILMHLARLYDTGGKTQQAEATRVDLAQRFAIADDWTAAFRIQDAMGPRLERLHEALANLRQAVVDRSKDISALTKEIIDARRELLPDDHPIATLLSEYLYEITKSHANYVGFSDSTRALFEESEYLAEHSIEMRPEKRAAAAWWLAYDLKGTQEYERALPLAKLACEIGDAGQIPNRGQRGLAKNLYGSILSKLGRFEEAEALVTTGFQEVCQDRGSRHADTDNALRRVIVHYREAGQPECALPYVLATMREGTGNTDALNSMLVARYPDVARKISALKPQKGQDRATLKRKIEEVIASRRSAIPDDDPYAFICADLMYSQTDNNARTEDCDLWAPLAAEALALHEHHLGANHRKTTYSQWWYAMTLVAAGRYAQGEEVARLGHATRLEKLSPEFINGHSRFEHILAGALLGQNRLDEVERILDTTLEDHIRRYGEANFHTLELIGHRLTLCAIRRQPEQAADVANPLLQGLLDANADAKLLLKIARKVVTLPYLGKSTYELALAVARSAADSNSKPSNTDSTIALALVRAGHPEQALKELGAIKVRDSFDPDEVAAVRILALAGSGRVDEANAAHIAQQKLLESREEYLTTPVVLRLLEEAKAQLATLTEQSGR